MLQDLPGPDKTYKRNFDAYCRWIDRNMNPVPRTNINRETIDHYFSEEIAKRTDIQPDTARRIMSSLQWSADRDINNVMATRFIVVSPIVASSLAVQKNRYRSLIQQVGPHQNLPTNIITIDEFKKGALYTIENCTYLMFCAWTLCFACLIRNDYFRNLTLCKFKTDSKNGPTKCDGDKRISTIVLRGNKKFGEYKDHWLLPTY